MFSVPVADRTIWKNAVWSEPNADQNAMNRPVPPPVEEIGWQKELDELAERKRLARQMGGDHALMAAIISGQTVLAFLTLPLTLWLLRLA